MGNWMSKIAEVLGATWENTLDDDAGEETQDDDSGEETQSDDSGEEAQDDGSGEETQNDDSGEETQNDVSGEEAQCDDSTQETQYDDSGEETQNDGSGEETQDDGSGEEEQGDDSWEETQDTITVHCDAARVLENYMLLDKILKYAMFEGDRVLMDVATNSKLVSTLWLERASVALHQHGLQIVFLNPTINLGKTNHFIHTFRDAPTYRIPRVHLTITLNLWEEDEASDNTNEMLKTTSEYLTNFSAGLVGLTVERNEKWDVAKNCSKSFWTHLDPRNLEELTIELDQPTRGNSVDTKNHSFPEAVLAGCKRLQRFHLYLNKSCFYNDEYDPDPGIKMETLKLPPSLESVNIVIENEPWAHNLECLLLQNSSLPNLTSLSLFINTIESDTLIDKLYFILHSFRRSLKKLNIGNDLCTPISFMKIPVMENLEELNCSSWILERANTTSSIIPTFLPALKLLTCRDTTRHPGLDFTWTKHVAESSQTENLDFEVHVLSADVNEELLLRNVCNLTLAFPYVTHMKVCIPLAHEMSAVRQIFIKVQQLRELEIHLYNRVSTEYSADIINALLLGLLPEEIPILKEELENGSNVNVVYDVQSSIVNLQALQKFSLRSNCASGNAIYLDVSLRLAFCRMRNLTEFCYGGAFLLEAPLETIQNWVGPRTDSSALVVKDIGKCYCCTFEDE